ncbi:MAG: type II secretion system protein [Proteobacteria bacterium]|nr:type II secretion system protein [Pseudomonadota bacterium]
MKAIVQRNKKGFTLIETLIAITILTIAMLAVLDTIVISFQHGIRNSIRNEAIKMAEKKMNELRNTAFSSLANNPSPAPTETRIFRNLTITFTQQWTVSNLSTNSAAIDVSVSWTYMGRPYTHSTTSIISQDA